MIPIILTEFPDVVEGSTEEVMTEALWHDGKTWIKRHGYNEKTYTYIGEVECQASPLDPGRYLFPPYVTQTNPFEVVGPITEQEEYYYNKEKETWDKRPNIKTVPVYNKRSGELIEEPYDENRDQYTFIQPPNRMCKWNEDIQNWEMDIEMVKGSMLSTVRRSKFEYEAREGTTSTGKTMPAINALNEVITINNSISEGETSYFSLQSGELIEYTKAELVEIINHIKDSRVRLLKAQSYLLAKIEKVTSVEEAISLVEAATMAEIDGIEQSVEYAFILESLTNVLDGKEQY